MNRRNFAATLVGGGAALFLPKALARFRWKPRTQYFLGWVDGEHSLVVEQPYDRFSIAGESRTVMAKRGLRTSKVWSLTPCKPITYTPYDIIY